MRYDVTIYTINDEGNIKTYKTTADTKVNVARLLVSYKPPKGYRFDRFECIKARTIFDF